MDAVIDYPARDMTITVQAGITISKLQSILSQEGQQIPVDIPNPDRATLGGAIATNASGPRRFGNGTLRDYVIGISVVNDEGLEVKGGGRVVKNVAGYDLMKLYVGSLGTLGIVTQVTLKVKPLPEATAAIVAPCRSGELDKVLSRFLAQTKTRPTIVSLTNAVSPWARPSDSGSNIMIGLEEKRTAVEWQLIELTRELPELEKTWNTARDGEAIVQIRDWSEFPLAEPKRVSFKANMLPAKTVAFYQYADGLALRPALMAHVGSGIVCGHLPESVTKEQAIAVLTDLGREAEVAGGNMIVSRCPPAWNSALPIWGRSTLDRRMMRAVKDKLDPRRVFNPGRFVDGI
jgi:glycolate oxidase FAD binding subunit